jgi:L-ascorbate metabolism protein UlaG (beta-lactamase superfamily)
VKLDIELKKKFSRRDFIVGSGLATAGMGAVWLKNSNAFAARFIRDRWAETGQAIREPKFRPTPETWNPNGITLAWLGHSTVLINFFGVHILTDPVLCSRVGANVGLGTLGPKRLIAPALTACELPRIDLLLLSHAHMDHFDFPTLKCFPSQTKVVTARSTADLFPETGLRQISELGWGQKKAVETEQGAVQVEAFEVNHWGARWRHDSHRGYNGYIVEREGRKIIFGGDTAPSNGFAGIRSKGPFEIACMPIGAYAPWTTSHCTPEEAVSMANDAGANYFLPIHHRTFRLGHEGKIEPLERLQIALQREPQRIALREIGETFSMA